MSENQDNQDRGQPRNDENADTEEMEKTKTEKKAKARETLKKALKQLMASLPQGLLKLTTAPFVFGWLLRRLGMEPSFEWLSLLFCWLFLRFVMRERFIMFGSYVQEIKWYFDIPKEEKTMLFLKSLSASISWLFMLAVAPFSINYLLGLCRLSPVPYWDGIKIAFALFWLC